MLSVTSVGFPTKTSMVSYYDARAKIVPVGAVRGDTRFSLDKVVHKLGKYNMV